VKKVATVDEYLVGVPPRSRVLLRTVRRTIKAAAPRAKESISYGIPTYKVDGERLIYFSAAKSHCAIHMVRRSIWRRPSGSASASAAARSASRRSIRCRSGW